MDNEKRIIGLAKLGDEEAFEEIVKTFQLKIYNIALGFIKNEQDALDVTQDVFIRIYKSISNFNEESKLSTWIYKIACNMCIDFLRKRKEAMNISIDDSNSGFVELIDRSVHANPVRTAEKNEIREEIDFCMDSLSAEHREIIVLREILGLSYDEIGEFLSLERGTVKSRISRARKKLSLIFIQRGNIIPLAESKIK